MSDLRESAQQALEALEGEQPGWRTPAQERSIVALRAALAQPAEPWGTIRDSLRDMKLDMLKREAAQQAESVAMLWKVRKALQLASAICDRVPNRWHHTHEIGSAEADIGDMVNAHPDGTHGYRLIQEAEAELVAYLTTPEATPPAAQQAEPVAPPQRRPLTEGQQRDLVKESGLDWHREYMPLFDGDKTNRLAVLIEAVERAHGIGGDV